MRAETQYYKLKVASQLASWRWLNIETTSVVPLAHRCQKGRWPDVTLFIGRWYGVGKPPLDWRHFFQFAQHWHDNTMPMSSLKCYTTFKATLTTFGQAPINWYTLRQMAGAYLAHSRPEPSRKSYKTRIESVLYGFHDFTMVLYSACTLAFT